MELREKAVTPHLAQNGSGRRSPIDGRIDPPSRLCDLAAHPQTHRRGLRLGQDSGRLRKMRHRGLPKVDWQFTLAMAAYDLVRLPKLLAEAAL
jgi:hypothetical protein